MMKNTLIVFVLLLCTVLSGQAQMVADRTNEVQLDFNKPIVTTKLPRIEWDLPRLEYTNSQENKVDVKATVTSVVPLKSVRLAKSM